MSATTGTIKRITDKGFGFIATPDGTEYFFHQSACTSTPFVSMREGEKVTFTVGQGPKGPRAENVVPAAELPHAFDGDDVLRLLDHANQGSVSPWVAADTALFFLGHVAAHDAEPHLVLDLHQDGRQPAHVDRVGGEHVEGDPLSALRADARQPAEFVDEVLDDALVHSRP